MSETPKKTPKTVIAGVVIILIISQPALLTTSPRWEPTMTTNSQYATPSELPHPIKIAMILPGRIDDLAWNQAGYTSFEDFY